jgi:hypothetical protein
VTWLYAGKSVICRRSAGKSRLFDSGKPQKGKKMSEETVSKKVTVDTPNLESLESLVGVEIEELDKLPASPII